MAFDKGHKPWNKGLKGYTNPGTFKKGHQGLSGESNPAWKGGRFIDEKGYVRIYIGNKQYKTEHRVVVEQYLGRTLAKDEHVHHKNGYRNDNRLENLEILSRQEHGKLHGKDAVLSPLHPNNKLRK